MLFLKQSTASQSVLIGPFVDSTDGVTAETGLTVNASDIRVSKNGANIVAKNSGGGTHDENGWYTITLDATDTNTVGRLQVHCAVSGALPVFSEFQVLEEAVYDELFASGATGVNAACDTALSDYDPPTKAELDSGLAALNDLSAAQVNAEVDTALADYDPPTKAELDSGLAALNDPTAAAIRAEMDSNSTQLAAIVADTNELQTDDVPGLIAALNDPTAAAIADQVWDEAKAGHVGAGSFGEEVQAHALSSEISALNDLSAAQVNAEVDTALADYDGPTKTEMDAGFAGQNDLDAAGIRSAVGMAGADLDTQLSTIDANVDSVLADTGTDGVVIASAQSVQSVDNEVTADVTKISGSATAAANLEASALGIVATSVNDASATTTSFVTALTETTDDHYNGRIIVFTSGALAGQATDITDYNGTTKAMTVTALTEAPANSTTFTIV